MSHLALFRTHIIVSFISVYLDLPDTMYMRPGTQAIFMKMFEVYQFGAHFWPVSFTISYCWLRIYKDICNEMTRFVYD